MARGISQSGLAENIMPLQLSSLECQFIYSKLTPLHSQSLIASVQRTTGEQKYISLRREWRAMSYTVGTLALTSLAD
jgi:hypothetical protein